MIRILSVVFFFFRLLLLLCSQVLISAESKEVGRLSWKGYATDAQMWCHSNAPSREDKPPISHLSPSGFPYDIQSCSWVRIMH